MESPRDRVLRLRPEIRAGHYHAEKIDILFHVYGTIDEFILFVNMRFLFFAIIFSQIGDEIYDFLLISGVMDRIPV